MKKLRIMFHLEDGEGFNRKRNEGIFQGEDKVLYLDMGLGYIVC